MDIANHLKFVIMRVKGVKRISGDGLNSRHNGILS